MLHLHNDPRIRQFSFKTNQVPACRFVPFDKTSHRKNVQEYFIYWLKGSFMEGRLSLRFLARTRVDKPDGLAKQELHWDRCRYTHLVVLMERTHHTLFFAYLKTATC